MTWTSKPSARLTIRPTTEPWSSSYQRLRFVAPIATCVAFS
jgi:hypothetical protein